MKVAGFNQCKETVIRYTGTWPHAGRCSRKAVRDGYCKQHHPDAVAERERQREERWQKEQENSPWRALERARQEIERLRARVRELEGGQQ